LHHEVRKAGRVCRPPRDQAIEEARRLDQVTECRAEHETSRSAARRAGEPCIVEREATGREREERRPIDASPLWRSHELAGFERRHASDLPSGAQRLPEAPDPETGAAHDPEARDRNGAHATSSRPSTRVTLWPPKP